MASKSPAVPGYAVAEAGASAGPAPPAGDVSAGAAASRTAAWLDDLETIFRCAPVGLAVFDLGLRYVRINERLARINGAPVEAHVGRTVAEMVPGLAQQARTAFDAVLRTGEPQADVEFHGETPAASGVVRTWIEQWHPVRDRDGRIVGVGVVVDDVTERRRIEAALRESEARLAAVVDCLPVGVWIADPQGRLVGKNEQADRIWSGDAPLLEGPENYGRYVAWDARSGRRLAVEDYPVAQALASGRAVEPVELAIRRFDGSDGVVLASAAPVRDDAGRSLGVVGINLDVTGWARDERARRESEERFRALFELSPDAAWVTLDDRVVQANSAAARVMGARSPGELVGLVPLDVVEPPWRPAVRARIAKLMAGERLEPMQSRWRRLDGAVIDVETNAALIPWHGKPAIQVILRDITDRKRIEQALRDSEEFARRIADVAPCILYIYDLDERRNVWGNREMTSLLGLTREQVDGIGGDLIDTLMHPDDVPAHRRHLERIVALADEATAELEYRMRGVDGAWKWLLSSDMVFRRRADGRPQQIVGAALDISARKHAEDELRGSEERFRVAMETSLVPFTILRAMRDRHGRIEDFEWLYANPAAAAVLERPVEALRGARLLGVLPGNAGGSRLFDAYVRVVETGQGHDIEVPYSADGIDGVFRNICTRLHDGVAIWFMDITQSKRAEEALSRQADALREADRRKDEFLAMLAHELRNPLTPITNAVRLLEREAPLSSIGQRSVEMIARQARQMKRLVDDLMEVSRITRGTIALRPEPVVLGTLVLSAVEGVLPACRAKGQTLEAVIPPRPVDIVADPVRIAQVLENLLVNANKYTPDGGTIRVELLDRGDAVEMRVEDTGIGIEPDQIGKVFDLFVQAAPAAGGHLGGLGIGLALVRRLVEMHGGRVEAASDGAGMGAMFSVVLPRG